MSAIAPAVAPPPAAAAPEAGRLKRKAKVPERYQSPPPAKRVRLGPSVKAKKPANGDKGLSAPHARRVGKTGKPPRAPPSKAFEYHHVAPADTGVSAVALAALSSPSAAALLGQSPVPPAVANKAMEEAVAMLAQDKSGGLAGLALLLAASTGSPFRADFQAAEDKAPKVKGKTKGRVDVGAFQGAKSLAQQVTGVANNAIKGWGEGTRRKRTTTAGGVHTAMHDTHEKESTQLDTSEYEKTTEAAQNALLARLDTAQNNGADVGSDDLPSDFAQATAATALTKQATNAVLKHCLRWMDLVVADLKGRAAALRRSRRRLQKVKQDCEKSIGQSDVTVPDEEQQLLRDLDRALAAESRGVDASLRAANELRGVAAGDKAVKASLLHRQNKLNSVDEDTTLDGQQVKGRGRGRPKGPAFHEQNANAKVGDRFTVVQKMLRGEFGEAITKVHSILSPNDVAASAFEQIQIATADAFLKTGLEAAGAELRGDYDIAATVACPANLTQAAHIPKLATV